LKTKSIAQRIAELAVGGRLKLVNHQERMTAYQAALRLGVTITTQRDLAKGGYNVWRVS
jgi:hypothetical protein